MQAFERSFLKDKDIIDKPISPVLEEKLATLKENKRLLLYFIKVKLQFIREDKFERINA